jgi:hypothetical protein
LWDEVHHISQARIDERQSRLRAFEIELSTLRQHRQELEERIAALEAARDQRIEDVRGQLADVFAGQLDEVAANCPDESDAHLFGRWSGHLLLLEDNAKRFARARDYEGAKTEHRRAEGRQAEEIKRKIAARRMRIERLKGKKQVEQDRVLGATVDRIRAEVWAETRIVQTNIDRTVRMIRTTETDLDRLRRTGR